MTRPLSASLESGLGLRPVRTLADLPDPNENGQRIIGRGRSLFVVGSIGLRSGEQIVVNDGGSIVGRARESDSIVGDKDGDGAVRVAAGGYLAELTIENTSTDSNARSVTWNLNGTQTTRARGLRLVGANSARFRGGAGGALARLRLSDVILEAAAQIVVADDFSLLELHRCTGLVGQAGQPVLGLLSNASVERLRVADSEFPLSGAGVLARLNGAASVSHALLSGSDFRPRSGAAGNLWFGGPPTTVVDSGNAGPG